MAGLGENDFATQRLAPAEVGAQPRLPSVRQRPAVANRESKGKLIADEPHEAFA